MTDSRLIKVRCPQCGHVFEVDLAQVGTDQIIYKGDEGPTEYRLRCPVDHAFFVVTVRGDAPDAAPPARGAA